jgi:hypothetical protein
MYTTYPILSMLAIAGVIVFATTPDQGFLAKSEHVPWFPRGSNSCASRHLW